MTERERAEHVLRTAYDELEQRVVERTAELALAKDQAESADRLKSAFLATMSHELRTPLNSILGFTGILLQGMVGELNGEQTNQLGMVKSSAHHLLALINDVLDISKIEAGEVELGRALFDVGEVIERTREIIAPLADSKSIDLVVEVGPGIGALWGDERRVQQVLLNLLNNAVKFTERGEVRLECTATAGEISFRVVDTGIGIERDDLVSLFEPFQQVNSGLARRHEGTGLGLAICRRLVVLMGGKISVDSEIGRGSVFEVVLPGSGESEEQ